ncbi:hypothetical protein PICSAR249_02360 [Mycobacterium avium subsp. paratuberculosis]|nr:hypothetical protein PICSAR249_02360 [Mycobacterium avium subsp. paratuberculosis]
MPGAGTQTACRRASAARGAPRSRRRARPAGAAPLCALLGGIAVGVGVQRRPHLGHQAADEGLDVDTGAGGGVVGAGRRRRPLTVPEIPADQADRQHGAGGTQHQREPLDQRIAAVDQQVFEPAHLGVVEQPVGPGHRAEQDQRRLDDRGEDAVLAHRQHRRHATGYIEAREDVGQLLVTSVDSIADGGRGDGDKHGRVPGEAWDVWVDRMVGALHRRTCPLC